VIRSLVYVNWRRILILFNMGRKRIQRAKKALTGTPPAPSLTFAVEAMRQTVSFSCSLFVALSSNLMNQASRQTDRQTILFNIWKNQISGGGEKKTVASTNVTVHRHFARSFALDRKLMQSMSKRLQNVTSFHCTDHKYCQTHLRAVRPSAKFSIVETKQILYMHSNRIVTTYQA